MTDPGPKDDAYFRARQHYEAEGFGGWQRFSDLATAGLPAERGVYVVLRPSPSPVSFLAVSPAGWYKGKDPTVDVARLSAEWVPATAVVYIGKATRLRERLNSYRRHGSGSKAAHWGGRFIWQCSDSDDYRVGWKTTSGDPGDVEFDLIADFQAGHGGRLPFANLKRGSRRTSL